MTEADLEAQMDAYWNKVPEIAAKKLNKELEDDMEAYWAKKGEKKDDEAAVDDAAAAAATDGDADAAAATAEAEA